MTATTESLLDAALALPEDERFQFAEALLVSFQPSDAPPFDETWRGTRSLADQMNCNPEK